MAQSTNDFPKQMFFVVSFEIDFDMSPILDFGEASVFETLKEARAEVEELIKNGVPAETLAIYGGTFLTRPKFAKVEWE